MPRVARWRRSTAMWSPLRQPSRTQSVGGQQIRCLKFAGVHVALVDSPPSCRRRPRGCHEDVTSHPKLSLKHPQTVVDSRGSESSHIRRSTVYSSLAGQSTTDPSGLTQTALGCLRSRRPQVRILPGAQAKYQLIWHFWESSDGSADALPMRFPQVAGRCRDADMAGSGIETHQSRHLPTRTLLLQSGNGDQPLSQ